MAQLSALAGLIEKARLSRGRHSDTPKSTAALCSPPESQKFDSPSAGLQLGAHLATFLSLVANGLVDLVLRRQGQKRQLHCSSKFQQRLQQLQA